jgi:hypothetical protein
MMRRLVYGLLGTALLVGQAAAAEPCKRASDREVFDLAALKSEAMVLAESCHQEERYNAFIQRYKPVLLANEHAFDAYFKRVFGRSGQSEHDAYITSLANAQSDVGLQEGTDFCPHTDVIFTEVMAIPSPQQLTAYAAGKDLLPDNLGACIGPEAPVSKARATTRPPAKH